MSLQIECCVEESVTIRAIKAFWDCINVAHAKYMIIVFQQSDSIVVFLHTPPSELTYNVPLYNINIISISISAILSNSRSSINGMSFIWTPRSLLRLRPSILFVKKLKISDVSSPSLWFPCKWRTIVRKNHKLTLYDCVVFSSKVRQLIVKFFNRVSGKTASLQPIGTS